MTLVAVCSTKGSPGATTTALAVCAAERSEEGRVLVEMDAAGGSLAAQTRATLDPGLLSLAAAARRRLDPWLVGAHSQLLSTGTRVVAGPTSPERARSAVGSLAPGLAAALHGDPYLTVIDCGRWEPNPPVAPLIASADAVILVLRPSVVGTEHARSPVESLRVLARELHVVCVGDAPYSPDEVAAALDVPISPNLAWDPRAARLLAAGARLDHWLRRSALLRSARTLLSDLEPSREAARA